MSIEKIREEYDKLQSAITVAAPFVSSLLRRVRIILSRGVPTAAVTSRGVMKINPDFWAKLSAAEKAWLLGHETLHIAFRDLRRRGDRNPKAWNIVADAVNNEIERGFLKLPAGLKNFIVTIDAIWYDLKQHFESMNIHLDDLKAMSKEELYKVIPWQQIPLQTFTCDIIAEGGEGDEGVIQEGDPEIYGEEGEEASDVDEKWKENIAKAYSAQKMAGNIPASLKRIVDELLKSKVDWRSMLRQTFRNGFGRTVVSSYLRPSRKHPAFPGVKRYTIPKVWCLVDTSGSISEEELRQFLSEIYNIAKTSPVAVIAWDAEAYDIVEAKTQSQVISKVVSKMKGGGGTCIAPVLKKTLKQMRLKDIVVVFTDGEIYDIKDDNTKRLLADVAAKSSASIFATTHREHEIDRWTTVKVKVNHD